MINAKITAIDISKEEIFLYIKSKQKRFLFSIPLCRFNIKELLKFCNVEKLSELISGNVHPIRIEHKSEKILKIADFEYDVFFEPVDNE